MRSYFAIRKENKMGRLIDADALKQDLRKCQIESLIAHTEEKNVFDVINDQPTAYDVEKVLAELEEYKKQWIDSDYLDGVDEIIDIVKAGGVEWQN